MDFLTVLNLREPRGAVLDLNAGFAFFGQNPYYLLHG